jgi:AcrR family transcriptional regulator
MKKNSTDGIILIAQNTFRKYGFKKTTMDEIAFAAGKTKSTMYYYFESKEEVFKAVVEKEVAQLRSEIQEEVNGKSSSQKKLQAYIFTRMKGFRKLGNFYELLKDEFISNLEFAEKIRTVYDRNETEVLTQIIQEGIDNKEFKNLNARLTARTIVIAMKGLEAPALIETNIDAFMKEIEDMLNILFYGICT